MKKLSKLIAISLCILMMTVLFTGCSKKEQEQINFFNYGENIDDETIKEFEKTYNIKVNMETFDDMEAMYQKINSGAGKYDVVLVSDALMPRMIEKGLVQKLNKDNIPNISQMDKQYLDLDIDPGNQYSVPYMFGTVGLIYNKDVVKEKVDSWDILWDEKYKDQIFMFDTYRDTIGVALKKLGFETIIVNCNPETVSTDYDTSDKLYFEPLTLEDVLSIHEKEKPLGVIAQFGGQTPLNLASQLKENGVNILGTTPETIDMAEDRDLFNEMMEKLEIPMPESGMAVTVDDALEIAQRIGYPLMVRPSYVLGGRGMEVVYDDESLKQYMAAAVGVTPDRPILIDRFLNDAMECEADAISDGENVFVPAVMEHIELAGIHSGDSACILPSKHIPVRHVQTIKEYTKKIAKEMNVRGLMNMQYAIADDKVYVLEANPRASRTVPLVSKVCNINMVKLATDIVTRELTGRPSPVKDLKDRKIPHIGVKQAVFPFNMFPEVDPILGPEMRSTGEVLGLANSYGAAIFKAEEATQTKLPTSGRVLISVSDRDKKDVVELARKYYDAGFEIVATGKTFELINSNNIPAIKIKKIKEGRPNIVDALTNGELDMVINTPHGKESAHDDSYIRKTAIKMKIPYMTNIAAANAAVEGILEAEIHGTHEVKSLQEYHKAIKD